VPAASSGATSPIAAHAPDSCCSLLAAIIRTARSRSSGGYLLEELPDKSVRSVLYQSSGGLVMLSALG
jgi:hypothetical protein